jgi:hypothetical protein
LPPGRRAIRSAVADAAQAIEQVNQSSIEAESLDSEVHRFLADAQAA